MQILPGLVESSGGTKSQQKTEKKSYSDMFSLLLGRESLEKAGGKKGDAAGRLQAEIFSRLSVKDSARKNMAGLSEQIGKAGFVKKMDQEDEKFVSTLSFFLNLLTGFGQTRANGSLRPKTGVAEPKKGSLSGKELYQGVLAEIRLLLQKKGMDSFGIQAVLADLEQDGKSVDGKICFETLKEKILAAWKCVPMPENDKAEPEKIAPPKKAMNLAGKKLATQAGKQSAADYKTVDHAAGQPAKTDAEPAVHFQGPGKRSGNFALTSQTGIEQTRPGIKKAAQFEQRPSGQTKSAPAGPVSGKTARPSAAREHLSGKQEELLDDIRSRLQQILSKSGLEKTEARQVGEQILSELRQVRFESPQPEKFSQERLGPLKDIGRFVHQAGRDKAAGPNSSQPHKAGADKQGKSGPAAKETGNLAQPVTVQNQAVKAEAGENLFNGSVKNGQAAVRPGQAEAEVRPAQVTAGTDRHQAETGTMPDTKVQKQAAFQSADAAVKVRPLAADKVGTDDFEKKQTVQESDAVQQNKGGQKDTQPVSFADVRPKKMIEREQIKEPKTDIQRQTKESMSARNIEDTASGNFNKDQENFSSSRQDMFARENGKADAPQPAPANEKSFRLPTYTVARQIEQGVFRNMQPGARQIVLQLNPVELGSVMVMLRVNKDREVQAVLRAGNQEAARIIGEQAQQLRQSLESQGLKVSRLDVEHDTGWRSDADSSAWQQQNRQENGGPKSFRDQLTWRNQRKNEPETDVSAVLEHELHHTVYRENFSSGVDIFA